MGKPLQKDQLVFSFTLPLFCLSHTQTHTNNSLIINNVRTEKVFVFIIYVIVSSIQLLLLYFLQFFNLLQFINDLCRTLLGISYWFLINRLFVEINNLFLQAMNMLSWNAVGEKKDCPEYYNQQRGNIWMSLCICYKNNADVIVNCHFL